MGAALILEGGGVNDICFSFFSSVMWNKVQTFPGFSLDIGL